MQSTLCGRVDRFFSFLNFSFIFLFFDAAVFADFHGTMFYGAIIAFFAAWNSNYQFIKKSASAKERAYQYLVLIRDEPNLIDNNLLSRFKQLEKHDSHIFASLGNAAQQKVTIVLGLKDEPAIKLICFEKIMSWLAGNLPNQSEYLKNNTGSYPENESDN